MPFTCVVPNCKGNYRSGPKVAVFKFPKCEAQKSQWIHAIKRKKFTITSSSRVCEKHFKPNEIIRETKCFDEKSGKMISVRLKFPKLQSGAIPSLYPNCPAYMTASPSSCSRESPEMKRKKRESYEVKLALENSLKEKEDYETSRRVENIDDIFDKINFLDIGEYWTPIRNKECIMFLHIVDVPNPKIKSSVVIDNNLIVSANIGNSPIEKVCNTTSITNITELNTLLNFVKAFNVGDLAEFDHNLILVEILLQRILGENTDIFQFILEQLKLFALKDNRKQIRYSTDLLVFSSLFLYMAPHAYKFVRDSGFFILPHPSTLHRICFSDADPQLEQKNNFLGYAKLKSKSLTDNDRYVTLMVDEIHIKKCLDFKGGNIVGATTDGMSVATSAHVFMVNSILSPFKDVVHILPVKSFNAEFLHVYIRKIIVGLEGVGFFVIAVITDNNSINRSAMAMFTNPPTQQIVHCHPVDKNRPLFYVVDAVHLLKCIRNNWVNQRYPERALYYPPFEGFTEIGAQQFCTASLLVLEKVHTFEAESLLKFGYNLSYRALHPTNIEKQNVKLALQIFNDLLAEGLLELNKNADIVDCASTSHFLKIILRWWNIINVKTPLKGIAKNDIYQEPVTSSENDERILFLHMFIDWLDAWEAMGCDKGKLTKETHSALRLTTYSLIEICKYCFEELKMSYVLLGKFQTDSLESRFSKYRQFSGAQYNVSLRQVFEVEKKLRNETLLKAGFLDNEVIEENCHSNPTDISCFNISVSDKDLENSVEKLPVIAYVGGYCVRNVLKKVKCNNCMEALIVNDLTNHHSLINAISRGKLVYPEKIVVDALLINYIVIEKLCTVFEEEFLKQNDQRRIAHEITYNLLIEREIFLPERCEKHPMDNNIRSILWASTNVYLNNFCKKKNDLLVMELKQKKKQSQKKDIRKIQTLSK